MSTFINYYDTVCKKQSKNKRASPPKEAKRSIGAREAWNTSGSRHPNIQKTPAWKIQAGVMAVSKGWFNT